MAGSSARRPADPSTAPPRLQLDQIVGRTPSHSYTRHPSPTSSPGDTDRPKGVHYSSTWSGPLWKPSGQQPRCRSGNGLADAIISIAGLRLPRTVSRLERGQAAEPAPRSSSAPFGHGRTPFPNAAGKAAGGGWVLGYGRTGHYYRFNVATSVKLLLNALAGAPGGETAPYSRTITSSTRKTASSVTGWAAAKKPGGPFGATPPTLTPAGPPVPTSTQAPVVGTGGAETGTGIPPTTKLAPPANPMVARSHQCGRWQISRDWLPGNDVSPRSTNPAMSRNGGGFEPECPFRGRNTGKKRGRFCFGPCCWPNAPIPLPGARLAVTRLPAPRARMAETVKLNGNIVTPRPRRNYTGAKFPNI